MPNEQKEVNREALEIHNWLREIHGCAPLKYSKRLAINAQSYAEYLAKHDLFDHSECKNYGENLIVRKGPVDIQLTGGQATYAWYSESQHYDFKKNTGQGCGHFTQLIWKDTKKVGLGIARSKDRKAIYIVAHYYPPGNYEKDYKQNVPPPERGRLYKPTNRDLTGEKHVKSSPRCQSCNSKVYYFKCRSASHDPSSRRGEG
ncbi:hypothetical protein SprV_0702272000 [Sparganum proliferum]